MAKRPTKSALHIVSSDGETQPVTARDRLFNIATMIGKEKHFEITDAEAWALVDEQFIPPDDRARARYHRSANESFCQALETDARFLEAVEIAKGGVFG